MQIRPARFLLALSLLAIAAAPAAAQVDARIWIDRERDYYRRGDRMEVNFAVSDDAYVAVLHVDTNGYIDFVFPETPWDNEYVRGGFLNRALARDWRDGWTVRGPAGIGYFYIIASPRPLDFSYFRGRTGSPWDWGYSGRVVHGDPFLAFDQIARSLVRGWPNAPYVYDYYSYYVDGIHRYPNYACSDRYYDGGWGWTPNYSSCGHMDYFLNDYPYYYDTRRYRGDRRVYLRQYYDYDPRHEYKVDPERRGTAQPRNAQPRDYQPNAEPRWDSGRAAEPRRDPVPEDRGRVDDRAPSTSRPNYDDSRTAEPRTTEPRRSVDSGSSSGRARPTPSTGTTRREPVSTGSSTDSRAPARGRP